MQQTPLTHWLRLLWNRSPPLHFEAAGHTPCLAAGALHLPAAPAWRDHCAAAAHAVAHLVYSPRQFDATGLVPIARTLLALLEDARVEALAMRELPGLARLWRPQHQATPASGEGFEPLLQRLARALADPCYDDPHPWVRKGRRLFYLDAALGLPALCTPAELRSAAMALGHDIGQLRLPFNAQGYRPMPAYRDDHRWMWPADQLTEVAPPPPEAAPDAGQAEPPPEAPPVTTTATRHPEWDHRIHRLRPDWCTVIEQRPTVPPRLPTALAPVPQPSAGPTGLVASPRVCADGHPQLQALARRLHPPLRQLSRTRRLRRLDHDGDEPDADALLHWQLARRAGVPGDARVHRAHRRQPARCAVWLLVDQSASSAVRPVAATPAGHPAPASAAPPLLATATQAAAATWLALRALGVACAVSGFASHGRHAVQLRTVVGLQDGPSPPGLAALLALRAGGSTRLGAALRHASAQLLAWRAGPRWVLLLSDTQVHDVDVHEPGYLLADARQAVQAATRRGVQLACLSLAAGPAAAAPVAHGGLAEPRDPARHLFGARRAQPLPGLQALPGALQRLLG